MIEITWWFLGGILGVMALSGGGIWLGVRRRQAAALEQLAAEARREAEDAVARYRRQEEESEEERRAKEIWSKMPDGTKKVVVPLQSLRNEERKAKEYRELIESVQAERDGWRDQYFSQAAGHEAAQTMLMREVERLTLLYQQATGHSAPVTRSAAAVRSAFQEAHGQAVAEYRQDGGTARAAGTRQAEAAEVERIERRTAE